MAVQADTTGADAETLEAGTYEVLRARMTAAAEELARRARALDTRRVETFGSVTLELAGTVALRTEAPCLPGDVVQVGGHLLLGTEPPAGLGRPAGADDVLTLHRLTDGGGLDRAATDAVPGLLDDARFRQDVADLYRYYRQARLLRLRRTGTHLLAVFRTGERADDTRTLRWRILPDGRPEYVDAAGERDLPEPHAHDVEWIEARREDQVPGGDRPHLRVAEVLQVSTVGGVLTVATDGAADGDEPLFGEPVEEPLQSLADAQVDHARVGPLVLLRVLPYNERVRRCLVFNERTAEVVRLDAAGWSCRRLPDDAGIVFPGGCYLAGEPAGAAARTFDGALPGTEDSVFDGALRAPNGEDVLFTFRSRSKGHTLLLPFNTVRGEVTAPLSACGHGLFADGTLALLRPPAGEPSRTHTVQLWHTPFTDETHQDARLSGDGPLARVGNAELVRGVADCLAVARLAGRLEARDTVFQAITVACTRALDAHHWLGTAEFGRLDEPLHGLRETVREAIGEFRRVEELRARARTAVETAERDNTALLRRARGEEPRDAAGWVELLTGLRRAQGSCETLRDLRYADGARITALQDELSGALDAAGARAVDRLARPGAFDAALDDVEEVRRQAADVSDTAAAEPLAARIAAHAEGLRLVTDVVAALDVADAGVRTALLERVGEVTGAVNGARSVLQARRAELAEAEAHAEFAAERTLFAQALTGALAAAGTPEDCDEQAGRLLAALGELMSRFGGSETHLAELTARQDEVQQAFAARKQAQLDERARRVERLTQAAHRSLAALSRRATEPDGLDALHALFAADPLAARVHTVVDELRALGEPVAAAELEGRLSAARQEAALALRDRTDLRDGPGTVRLGRHRFAVHDRPFALALVPDGEALQLTVTGTDYRAPVRDAALEEARRFWHQPLASESTEVYRAEHLAAAVLARAERGAAGHDLAGLTEAANATGVGEPVPELITDAVRSAATAAYDEGYDRGVHDHDAAAVLHTVLRLRSRAGLLRFAPDVRAAAQLLWTFGTDRAARTHFTTRARSLARARTVFGPATDEGGALAAELSAAARRFLTDAGLPGPSRPGAVGAYLLEELAAADGPHFVTGEAARALVAGFRGALDDARPGAVKEYEEDLAALACDHRSGHQLVRAWLGSYARGKQLDERDLPEAVALELCGEDLPRREVTAPPSAVVSGLRGTHPRVSGGELPLRLDEFLVRTEAFRTERAPAHRAFTRRRGAVLAAERERLGLDAHVPHVVPGFVRNRLIDEVYLPLLGDNLARQLGTVGADRRTDTQGLLLLLSPPGYGKTTLIEYAAARLGMLLVTVDGPALGRHTTSLDPAAAPDAAARREVEKIELALRMGSGVFLHLDDIQHTSPELLQRFVPLCDTQRRMDGASGRYDLRGKPFAVCMSGNPFTASGARFRVPDMLANRADIWNLGEVLAGREELFELSHVENALTSNPVLAPLAAREPADLQVLLHMAEGDGDAQADRLHHPYGPAELQQLLSVLRSLLRVRRTLLTVNAAYIASAAQDAQARTEPPFLLQGSYRDTVRLAARIEPVMNDAEVEALLDDHYRAEARTLTSGAEANLLKLAELRGRLTAGEARRWEEIKRSYRAQPAS